MKNLQATTLLQTLKLQLFAFLIAFFIVPSFVSAQTENIYISQSGNGTGASCESSRSAAWFNTSSNWTSAQAADGKIGPGDIIHLCGTITTDLAFQGSGTSGNYITLDGTGATMAGSFTVGGKSWWKIQNVTYSDGFFGTLLYVSSASNGIFTGNYADNFSGDNAVFLDQNGSSLPHDIVISNNFIRTSSNNFGNVQKDMIKTSGSYNVTIEGNYLEMRAGGSGSNAHDDVIQTFEKGGTSAGNPRDWTIRFNKIVMNSSEPGDRSWTMLESLSGTINIYGNIFLGIRGGEGSNGLCANSNHSGVVFNIFNNTFVPKNGTNVNVLNLANDGTAYIRNNIFFLTNQNMTGSMNKVRSHNLWYGSGPGCVATEICGLNPNFTDYANNDFSLLSNSPAINAGSNLGTSYNVSIAPGATWPNPALSTRPSSGNWEMGAYEFSSGPDTQAPTVPTGLSFSNRTQTSFTLSWEASTDNSGVVTGYEVFKNGVSIGTTTTTSMPVTGLTANTTYSMTVSARDAVPNWSAQSTAFNVRTLAVGEVESTSSWQSFQVSTQTGIFTAQFDAVPNYAGMDGITCIQNGTVTANSQTACAVAFDTDNQIRALNGGSYSSASAIPYSPGTSYHFRLVINIPAHTYSIYVTPQGQSEITVGLNYAFRTEQQSVTQLTGWSLLALAPHSHSVRNVTFTGSDTQAPSVPTGLSFSNRTQTSFTLSWTASSDDNGVTGYEVFKNGVSIGTTTTTSMPVTGLTANTTYSMTVRARDAVPNWSAQSTAFNVRTLAVGEVESTSSWQSFQISTQTGIFTAQFDAVPNYAGMDGITCIQNGTVTANSQTACAVAFDTDNQIRALNGGTYSSASVIPYTPDISYHFRLVINRPAHTYSIYVTPQGQSEITVGLNYAFRTEQQSVTQLTGWSLLALAPHSHSVSNVTFTGGDTQAPTVPTGLSATFKTQTSFTLSWTASSDDNGVTGYEVFKNGVSIGTTANTSMSVSGLTANTTYSMTVRARDAVPNWSAQSTALNVTTLPTNSAISSSAWQSFTLTTQTGTFTAEFDAIPNYAGMDGITCIQNGTVTANSQTACSVAFDTDNRIRALNGGTYSSASVIPYSPGTSYHFRLEINILSHTYSIYVTPQGQSEITVGLNFAFRTEQQSVTQLTGWSLLALAPHSHSVSNMTFTTHSVVSNTGWQNFSIPVQTGIFTAEFDAIPHDASMDGAVGILNGIADAYTDLACIVQFYSGRIEAMNGTAYDYDVLLNYTAGTSYHFRLGIDVVNHNYDIYVTPQGQSEITLGTGYAFRSSQATVTQLNGWAIHADYGSHSVSNMTITSGVKSAQLPGVASDEAGFYPNPATDFITIYSPNAENIHVQLYNMQGVKVMDAKNSDNKLYISSLSPGLYLLKLDNKTFKLMKK